MGQWHRPFKPSARNVARHVSDGRLLEVFKGMFTLTGSVFPKAFLIATPCALLCGILNLLTFSWEVISPPDHTTSVTTFWTTFVSLVGFLVVFRTSQAYNRFWEGYSTLTTMGVEWLDACSAVFSFCKDSQDSLKAIKFQNILVRLFSMLHASALQEIGDDREEAALTFPLMDPEGIDLQSLDSIEACEHRAELIYQWIQQLIVEAQRTKILNIPPPILTRAFHELGLGMSAFQHALKIHNVPFPFAYSQTCFWLLGIHWIFVPFIVMQWTRSPYWAFVFGFIQTVLLWALNFIACELENPFGLDAHDVEREQLQIDMNLKLRILLTSAARRTPKLSEPLEYCFAAAAAPKPNAGGRKLTRMPLSHFFMDDRGDRDADQYAPLCHDAVYGEDTCFSRLWRRQGRGSLSRQGKPASPPASPTAKTPKEASKSAPLQASFGEVERRPPPEELPIRRGSKAGFLPGRSNTASARQPPAPPATGVPAAGVVVGRESSPQGAQEQSQPTADEGASDAASVGTAPAAGSRSSSRRRLMTGRAGRERSQENAKSSTAEPATRAGESAPPKDQPDSSLLSGGPITIRVEGPHSDSGTDPRSRTASSKAKRKWATSKPPFGASTSTTASTTTAGAALDLQAGAADSRVQAESSTTRTSLVIRSEDTPDDDDELFGSGRRGTLP